MKEKNSSRKLVMASMLAALTCVATMIIKIPSPLNGYINLGDCFVLLAGWLLPVPYGFLAAGVGSALADVFSGYVAYAPATFVIKGLMAVVACYGYEIAGKKLSVIVSRITGGVLAEVLMVAGYLAYESMLYGFSASLVNVLPNCVQGLAGLVIGIILIKTTEKR